MFHVVFCVPGLYSIDSYLYISCSGSITSVGEERSSVSAIVYLWLCGFCSERFPLLHGARMGCVILLWHSLSLPCNYLVNHYANRALIVSCTKDST